MKKTKKKKKPIIRPSFSDKFMYSESVIRDKVWCTDGGTLIPFEELQDSHLENILNMYKQGLFKNNWRSKQEKDLKQEQLKRQSLAGKILYGNDK